MIKKIVILTIALLLMVVIVALFAVAPYHIYTLTLTEGVNTRFLKMQPSPTVFYDGQNFNFSSVQNEDKALFQNFHFSHFMMPLPYNHPIFSLIPTIKVESTGPRLGASFLDGKNNELFSYMVEKPYKLETVSDDQKLFLLPVFKNHIARKSDADVWRDLFFKKLSLPSNVGKGFYESLLALKSVSYSDLVYNLYILYNRAHLFPRKVTRISYDPESNHGLLEFPSDDPKYRVEKLFIINEGMVYPVSLRTKIDNNAAENYRNRILKEISYKATTTDSAIPIYAQYKSISYGKRIDQQGMTYLYAAWSHDLNNRDYIRVIILFLERGKSNIKFLKPFYEYAFKHFGSNLSSDNEFLLETADEKLKRNMKEELEGEIKKEEEAVHAKFEGNFSTPEEKIKFNLQKAKENKTNSDDSEKILLQE